jgi:signal recognition particle subunit SRP54
MPGVPGSRKGGRSASPPQRRKSKSGNPAKRAAEERAAAERSAAARSAAAGSAFGIPAGGDGASQFDESQLPAGFEKFLGGR